MIDHQNSKQNVSLLLGPKRDDVIIGAVHIEHTPDVWKQFMHVFRLVNNDKRIQRLIP